ncbi:MAG: iron-containing alcohol dehydrogenase [Treponema sp.]|jgi:alcohol dehydrogenase class IV|nr:iron-containing alcohol dehydrogenase [Treponema sp.]
MKINYHMPTMILMGEHCIVENRNRLAELGAKALIVTGKNSAKTNGSLADTIKALEAGNQTYHVFDKVMSNPTVPCVYEGAAIAREQKCDFVIALGGGSPMDASKVIAGLVRQTVPPEEIFGAVFTEALPIAAVPTTAGTGSEVTPYAILTNDKAQTKTSIAAPVLFPRFAFLDAKYMMDLPRQITVNTAVDALSHAIEGMLSIRASVLTDAIARESIARITGCFAALKEDRPDFTVREKLLYASTAAGMVIANTGTTAVHAAGYYLTYFKNADHGRANGLLLAEYLKFVESKERALGGNRTGEILAALNMRSLAEFAAFLDSLLGEREKITDAELQSWAEKAITSKSIANSQIRPEKDDLLTVLRKSLG